MANAKFTGLVSETIHTLNTAMSNYDRIRNDSHLPEALHGAGMALQSVHRALQYVQIQGDGDSVGTYLQSLTACNTKAKRSQEIFIHIAQTRSDRRLEAYEEAVRGKADGSMIEQLAKGMMADLCTLASHSTAKENQEIMKGQVDQLQAAMDRLSKMEPSISQTQPHHTFSNYGSGNQFNAMGGTQNNNTGNGYQFSGTTFTGPVNFGETT